LLSKKNTTEGRLISGADLLSAVLGHRSAISGYFRRKPKLTDIPLINLAEHFQFRVLTKILGVPSIFAYFAKWVG